ncbi:MAG: heavy metal-responsive transcriptional regulator [Alphaproteobacteria bacterium]|nr:heavy metal-responsive transcriptional regulator [Alphaproteobacteria bacterium]
MKGKETKLLTVGRLAERTGVSPDTLRYYEKMGLIKAASRSQSGYRIYGEDAERILQFIKGAKTLNFTLEEIRQLLTLNRSDKATCAEVLKHTTGKIIEAEQKIRELKEVKRILSALVEQCPADDTSVSSCPILGHINR